MKARKQLEKRAVKEKYVVVQARANKLKLKQTPKPKALKKQTTKRKKTAKRHKNSKLVTIVEESRLEDFTERSK